MADDERSVRIDLDHGVDGSPRVWTPEARRPRRPGVGLLAVVAGVCFLAVLALGPWRGAGNDRTSDDPSSTQAPAETLDVPLVSTPEEQAVELDEDGAPVEVPAVGDERLEQVGSMVRVDLGYLALLWLADPDGNPRLVRSPDGESWTDVVVSRPELGERVDGVDRRYSHLIRTGAGFAMLESVVGPFDASSLGTIPRVRVRRLTSPDGARWSLDPTFPEVERRTGEELWIWEHTEDMFVAYDRGSESNAPLTELLDTHVADGTLSGEPCLTQLSADRQTLRVSSCGSSGPEQSVTVDDLVGSVEIGALGDCARIVGGVFQTHDLVAAWAGADRPVVYEGLLPRSTWSAADTGAAVVFYPGSLLPRDVALTPCDGVTELPDRRPPGLVFHGVADLASREIALDPGLVDALDEVSIVRAAAVIDDDFRVVVDRSMWALDRATLEWTFTEDAAPSTGVDPWFSGGNRFAWETDFGSNASRTDILSGRRWTADLGPDATLDDVWASTEAGLLVRVDDERVVLVPWADEAPDEN